MTTCGPAEKGVFFVENEVVDTYTLTATSAVVGYSASRLKSTGRKLTWRSTSAAAQTIQGDWGISVPASAELYGRRVGIALVNHNLPDTSNINVKLYDDSLVLKVDKNFPGENYTSLNVRTKYLIDSIRPYKTRVIYLDEGTTEFTIRRWQITITGVGPAYWEIGRLLLGPVFKPLDNFYYGDAGIVPIDKSRFSETYGGDGTSDWRPKQNGVSIIPPEKITNSDVGEWLRMIAVNGSRIPILVDPYPRYPESNFTSAETTQAIQNLCWQTYGTPGSGMSIAPIDSNNSKSSGRLDIVGQA